MACAARVPVIFGAPCKAGKKETRVRKASVVATLATLGAMGQTAAVGYVRMLKKSDDVCDSFQLAAAHLRGEGIEVGPPEAADEVVVGPAGGAGSGKAGGKAGGASKAGGPSTAGGSSTAGGASKAGKAGKADKAGRKRQKNQNRDGGAVAGCRTGEACEDQPAPGNP